MTPSDNTLPATPGAITPPRFKTPFVYSDGQILDADGTLVMPCQLPPGVPGDAGEQLAETLSDYWDEEDLGPEEVEVPETTWQRRRRVVGNIAFWLIIAVLVADRFWPFLPPVGKPTAASVSKPAS